MQVDAEVLRLTSAPLNNKDEFTFFLRVTKTNLLETYLEAAIKTSIIGPSDAGH